MKNVMKRSFSVLMSLVMCVSMLFGLSFSAQAATGSYIYNWGVRGTTATYLSENAEAFYAENEVTLSELLALSGSSTVSNVPSSELYTTLQTLMTNNHSYKTSYDATKDLFMYTDCQNGGGAISSFYSGKEIGPTWDGAWNREHTWPNSKGLGGQDENDIMMLRPTSTSENSSRGNTAYGESSSYYDPNEESDNVYNLHGDVARIVLYVYVRWGNTSYMWGTSGVMESKDVLLKWMEEDPVDTWELGRNDSVEAITGTRNVFVDYPELAFDLFNEEVPTDYTTPSGSAAASDYTITATTNNSDWGTVSVSGSYINASPATGYEAAGYEIVSGSATVTQNGNSFRVSATSDVTIQINFAARTQKTITFNQLGTNVKSQTAYSGDTIALPEHSGDVKTGYTFLGWGEAQLEETTTIPTFYTAGSNYTVTSDIALYALYSRTEEGDTSNSDVFELYSGTLTAGDYLIVYDSAAMTAAITDNNRLVKTDVTISDSKIITTDETIIWQLATDGEYCTFYNANVLKYAAGNGTSNKATLIDAVTDYAKWTASGDSTYEFVNLGNNNDGVNPLLRCNTGDIGFACYATNTNVGGALSLYKRMSGTAYYFTIESDGNTGDGFDSDTETETCTVTYVENDKVISKVQVEKGKTITLPTSMGTVNSETFEGWVLKDSTEIITEYTVNADVTFYAKYKETESGDASGTTDGYYVKVTEAPADWSGEYLIVYEDGNVAFNGGLTTLDGTSNTIAVIITDNKIEATNTKASQLVIAKSGDNYTIQSASGYYIGQTSDANGLKSNPTTTYTNIISLNDDLTVNIVSSNAYLRFNAASDQMRFRYYKSSTYTNQKAIALYKLVESGSSDSTAPTGKIEGAQIEVGTSLTLNYYASLSNVADDAQVELRVTMLGKETTIERDITNIVDGKYVFTFDGITTQCMTELIDAELVLVDSEGETVLNTKEGYSIQQNAINLLTAYPDDAALKQFITDMLYYGAASQTYRGYNTENLATDVEGLGSPSDVLPSEDDAMSLINNADATIGDVYFKSATVWFDSINNLIIKLNSATENTELKLGGEVVMSGAGNTVYTTEEIKATDFDTVYTFELYEDGTLVQTLSYSVNAYAYSKMNSSDSNMSNLAIALYRYGVSAKAYAASLQ